MFRYDSKQTEEWRADGMLKHHEYIQTCSVCGQGQIVSHYDYDNGESLCSGCYPHCRVHYDQEFLEEFYGGYFANLEQMFDVPQPYDVYAS